MARCDSVISAEVGWSVQRLLSSEISWESVGIERIQPTLFAIEVALAALWSSWGIRPAVVVGHSMGEIAAAHVAGALSLEDAAAIICRRSALMGRFTGLGAMAMVELAASEAADALAGYEDRVSIAVINGPRSTVLSGEPAALREIVSRLKADEVFCRSVSVQVAAHSPQMDLIRDELLESLSGLRPRAGETPIYSTTLGRFTDGAEFDAGYWVANLRQPVLFHASVKALMSEGRDVFIEASPHPILLPAIDEMGRDAGSSILTVPSLRRNEPEQATILASLGQLFAYGEPVDWSGVYRSGRFSDAPRHPWRRRRYWAEMEAATPTSAAGGHPLLPPPLRTADHSWIWTTRLSADVLPWLKDHVVRDAALLPASAYLETMVMAAREMIGHPRVVVEGLQLKEAIILSGEQVVQLTITPERPGRWSARMHVLDRDADAWGLAASAHVLIDRADDISELEQDQVAGFARAPAAGSISREAHAGFLRALGYDFGRHFQNIEWLAVEGDSVRAVARLDDGLLTTAYGLHPALLDSGLQALMVGLSHRKPGQTLIPSSVERARIFPAARSASTAYILADSEPSDSLGELGWVRMYGTEGALLAELSGVRFQGFGASEPTESAPPFWSVDLIPADLPAAGPSIGRWLILADEKGLGRGLATELRASGAHVDVLTADLLSCGADDRGELQRAIAHAEGAQLVHLGGLDLPHDASTNQIAAVCAEVARIATAISEGHGETLALVSRGACAVAAGEPLSIPSAALWGLGAVIANESPSLSCRMIDLPREPDSGDMMDLAEELLRGHGEPRVALRGGRRFAARLRPHEEEARPAPTRPLYEGERAELVMANPGVLDSLSARRSRRLAPSAGEIEVEVHFAGLNFLDVIRAMDLFDPLAGRISSLGVECAGRVARIGEGVTEFQVGDNVVALSPAFHEAGTLASHLVTRASLAAKVPDGMDPIVAAGAPCVYLTSYLALVEMARVRAGETVLIHSATGGVGLAAIQVARWLGADIVASAGTEAKRAMLRDMGIERVFDSRTPEFAGDVKALTGGRGVDVVLNSLSGGAILEGLAALAPYGRFLEIGKRDMWDNSRIGFGALLSNRSIFGIDLATMIEDQPDRVGVSLRRIMDLVGDGTFAPLPITTFPAARAADALHLMAAAKHTGKLVVAMEGVRAPSTSPVRPDGAYLITGGFGALGLVAAETLAEAGAGALVLCGRSAPSARARESMDRLEAKGTAVVARSLDIGDEAQVRRLLTDISATLPPLRGVVHSAGVLDDALMEDLSAERFRTVLRGKAEGALLLDRLTAGSPLDFFVLFSSVAAVLGSPGQGNYAAANALLDALAEDRAARGQPAQSLAWGPWSEIGLAAADKNRGSRVAERGLHELSPREGRRLFESALAGGSRPYTAIMRLNAERWLEMAAPSTARFFADAMGRVDCERPAPAQPRTLEGKITVAEMKDLVTAQLSAVLRTPADRLGPARPFQSLGLDSLMGLELRNRLERALGWKLSASTVWNFPTVDRLCAHLVARAEAEARPEPSADVERKSAAQALGAELLEAEALLAGA
jgi:acyl transferase domain-containing protein/acyl carrier protein